MPEYKTVLELTKVGYEYIKYPNGGEQWLLDGMYHRGDGPSVKSARGYSAWFFNGRRHRPDGPAIKYPDGSEVWYLEGINLKPDQIEKMKHLLTCVLSELPLYMNTEFRSVVEWRLKQNA